MANKTLLYGSQSLEPDDQVLYVEVEPGVYAQAVASIIVSGAGDTNVNIEPALTDEITGAAVTIPVVHHEVHEGETFSQSLFSMNNPDGTDIVLMLRTGATQYGHLTFTVTAGGDAQVRLHENPVVSASGNVFTPRNMKRTEGDGAAQIVLSGNPTYTDGTILTNFLVPGGTGGNAQGGVGRMGTEWILRLNTDYLIELTNIAGNNQPLSIVAQWYEESSN
jgi:hypothetical protein